MDASQLLDYLSTRIYESPLAEFRDDGRICDTTNPLSVIMLLIDYETECSMNGILGFLRNSAGRRLPETVRALREIGCLKHADVLESIRATATDAGMTFDAMQEDGDDLEESEAAADDSFDEDDQWDDVCDTIQSSHENVDWSSFWDSLTEFAGQHLDSIRHQLSADSQ